MKRRLNYTNRRHLSSENVAIRLQSQSGDMPPKFMAQIDIPNTWKLAPNAKIYIEPYVASTSMRFDFGTVGEIVHPSDTTLSEIDAGAALFRVKIVDESGEIGLLLASAEEVRPREDEEEGEGSRAFFPLVLKDLGEAIWSVELTKSDRPKLQINNRIPFLRERLLSDPVLQGAILPAAMRIVLKAALEEDEFGEAEWVHDWRKFLEELGSERFPDEDENPSEDEIEQMISSAVERFSMVKQFVERARMEVKS
jgi:hypothetical protein